MEAEFFVLGYDYYVRVEDEYGLLFFFAVSCGGDVEEVVSAHIQLAAHGLAHQVDVCGADDRAGCAVAPAAASAESSRAVKAKGITRRRGGMRAVSGAEGRAAS